MMPKRRQAGTTLIEIMVSVVVMALGLLGLASLQLNAMRFQKTSSQRSEATQAAYDLGERMRSNWPSANSRAQNEARYTYSQDYTSSSTADQTPTYTCTATCNADMIADNDKKGWLLALQRRLVGGSGYVVPVAGGSGSTFMVTVMWKEPGFTTLDSTCPGGAAAPIGVRCFSLPFSV